MGDVISFNAAISACEKGRKWECALELLETMSGRGVKPNVVSFNAVISACEKGRKWERALDLLENMRARRVEPDLISFKAAIGALSAAGLDDDALELYAEALENGAFTHWSARHAGMLDFHNFPSEVAGIALRFALELSSSRPKGRHRSDDAEGDLIVITGRGVHSEGSEAKLKPRLLQALSAEYDPPLVAKSVAENPGRIRILEPPGGWASVRVRRREVRSELGASSKKPYLLPWLILSCLKK